MSYDTDAGSRYCTHTDYTAGEAAEDLPATGEDATGLAADVWAALYDVEDPEMPISIVDLGLIYGVQVDETAGHALVEMTLTYSGCPARDMLTGEVEDAVAAVEGVDSVELRLVWAPDWNTELVTETGREQLREFGLSI
jgi:metal-sulfur cluster biosynthetic enzyme